MHTIAITITLAVPDGFTVAAAPIIELKTDSNTAAKADVILPAGPTEQELRSVLVAALKKDKTKAIETLHGVAENATTVPEGQRAGLIEKLEAIVKG